MIVRPIIDALNRHIVGRFKWGGSNRPCEANDFSTVHVEAKDPQSESFHHGKSERNLWRPEYREALRLTSI